MSDGIEYAKMLEIPVSSYEIIVGNGKKKKKKDDNVKMVNKANEKLESGAETVCNYDVNEAVLTETKKEKKGKLKFLTKFFNKNATTDAKPKRAFDIVSVQIIAIFALVVAILLTNIFWEDSGINVFLKKTFASSPQKTVYYSDFNAEIACTGRQINLENGTITLAGEGSVYAPAKGTVASVYKDEQGKYVMTIEHSTDFKTVVTGLDYAYFEKGYTVYSTSPIGYSQGDTVTYQMYDKQNLITAYTLKDGAIVWEK